MARFRIYTSIHIMRTDHTGKVTRQVGCIARKFDNIVAFDLGLIDGPSSHASGHVEMDSGEHASFAVDSVETMRLLANAMLDEADRLDGRPEAQ